jgi:glycosyltransferase involved in cell wall biosynthesis
MFGTPPPAHPSAGEHSVSVVIPAYNSARTLGRTLESVISQTFPPLEILVVDDGSGDDTAAVAEAFGPPVRVIRKLNGGPASARNLGVHQARGHWIAFLDADDQWIPTKLERQLRHTGSDSIGLVHALIDRGARVPERLDFNRLWKRNWIVNSTVLIRRDVFLGLGGFNEARELISVEDYHLWVRVAAAGWQIALCPEVLAHYTRGIGISSNIPRFFAASLYNARILAEALSLPESMLKKKLAEICMDFGEGAIYRRDMAMARDMLLRSLRLQWTGPAAFLFCVAAMPSLLLDLRRLARRSWRNYQDSRSIRQLSKLHPVAYASAFRPLLPETPRDVSAMFDHLALHVLQSQPALAGQDAQIRNIICKFAWFGYASQKKAGRPQHWLGPVSRPAAEHARTNPPFLKLLLAILREADSMADEALGVDALQPHAGRGSHLSMLVERQQASEQAAKAYRLALMICQRRAPARGTAAGGLEEAVVTLVTEIVDDLRHALKDLRCDIGNADALYLWKLAEEISEKKPQLWVEALMLAEELCGAAQPVRITTSLSPVAAAHPVGTLG